MARIHSIFRSDTNDCFQRLVNSNFSFHVYRSGKLKTFEAVAWPPPIARKPRTDVRFIANALLFFRHRFSATDSFHSGTGISNASGTKFEIFPAQVQRFLDKGDKSPIRWSSPLSCRSTGYDSGAMELLPCFSVFPFQIFKRFFNRDFWSPCTKCWCGNRRVASALGCLFNSFSPQLSFQPKPSLTIFSASSALPLQTNTDTTRLDYQPLSGKGARAPSPNSSIN